MASVGVMQDTAHPLLPTASSSSNSSTGPRFRPYASPTHHVTKGRYITSNDARGYIPVYEYPLNGQWIMMDIDDGYILWTGIWKALGNSKADIVKMIDSQPDLAPLIRRVRGGYLKIQGTWMPYEVALKLSRRVAWSIRDDLIPLFGPTFPSTCLAPDQPGYGQVVPSGAGRRRARRATQAQGANFGVGVGVGVGVGGAAGVSGVMQMQMQMPVPVQRGGGVGGQAWTVVTPSVNGVQQHYQNQSHQNQPPLLHPVHPVQYAPSSSSPYSPHETQRYPPSSYPHSHPPTSFRKPSTSNTSNTKMGLSLDIRALSVREPGSSTGSTAPSPHDATAHSDPGAPIRLPPIQIQSRPHGHGGRGRGGSSPQAAYALPPISAMAEAGFVGGFGAGGSSFGSGTGSASGSVQDSAAAVLRRLRMSDEEAYGAGRVVGARSVEDLGAGGGGGANGSWGRRHSLSVHPATSRSVDTSPRFQPYTSPRSPRSYHEHDRERDRDREYERDRDRPHRPRSSSSSTSHSHSHHHHPYHNSYHQRSYNHHHHRAASPHSRTEPEHDREPPRAASTSHEGDSTSNPSPTSPTTPNSLLGHEHAHHHYGAREKHLPRVAGRLDEHDGIDKRWPLSPSPHEVTHSADSDDGHVHGRLAPPSSFPPRRSSYEVQSDSEMEMATHPHRPW